MTGTGTRAEQSPLGDRTNLGRLGQFRDHTAESHACNYRLRSLRSGSSIVFKPEVHWRLVGMNVLASDRRSALGLFPGQPTPRLNDCLVEALRCAVEDLNHGACAVTRRRLR